MHSGTIWLIPIYIYINTTCHVLTAAVCITFIIICIKNLLSTMCFLLKNYSLVESVCLEVLPAKHNTDRNNVKEQNGHWKGGGGLQLWAWMLLNSYFLKKQEKKVRTSTLFWAWELSRNRNQLFFFEKILYAKELKVKNVSLNVPDL